jgi:hypothetical protein
MKRSLMVNITKIVEKSLHGEETTRPEISDKLVNIFGSEEKTKKKVEKIDFSHKLGSVFGVTEPRLQEDG